MYEVNDKIMQEIKHEFIAELENRDYSYSVEAIDTILNEWFERKQMLLSLLSKHPNWNADRLMIHFDADFSRKLNTNATYDFFEWVREKGNTLLMDESMARKFEICMTFMWRYCQTSTYLEDACLNEYRSGYDDGMWCSKEIDALNELNELIPELHARVGQKNTKIVGKICSHFNIDKGKVYGEKYNYATGEIEENVLIDSYDKQFAKYCDAISPIKITRHTCVSLNPIDYLLMSNGNSWRSCHYIGDYANDSGCYSSGTISYMLDENSIIFYTVDANFDGEYIEREPKIQRQVFGYNDFQLMQSRLYPQNNDCGASDLYTDIRNIMQKVIADCLKEPNRWVKKKVRNVRHGSDATCYADWESQGSLCSTSVLRGRESDSLTPITLGAAPICIECGFTHSFTENINECSSGCHCENCGDTISNGDSIYWIGDSPYCCDCVTYCDCCDEYVLNDNTVWIERENRYVCDDCIRDYYVYCEECNEYVYNDEVTYISELGMWVCNDCIDRYYVECDECGKLIYKDEAINGLCEDCFNAKEENEEDDINE